MTVENPLGDLALETNTEVFEEVLSKVLINACTPHRYLRQSPRRTHIRRGVYDRVVQRWAELDLPDRPPELGTFFEGEKR